MLKQLFCAALLASLLSGLLAGCDLAGQQGRVYETNHDLPGNQWYMDTVPAFTFQITDAAVPYNLYYNVRNGNQYPYYNLFVTYYLEDAAGKLLQSHLQELRLADEKTGQPLGDGLGDIFDHQIIALKKYKFSRPGTYRFRVKQYMRQDPLPLVMSVGLRVEKAL